MKHHFNFSAASFSAARMRSGKQPGISRKVLQTAPAVPASLDLRYQATYNRKHCCWPGWYRASRA